MKKSNRRVKKSQMIIEAGTTSEGNVWIGVPSSCYDEIKKTRGLMHIFVLTVEEAEAVIEMMEENIVRLADEINTAINKARQLELGESS